MTHVYIKSITHASVKGCLTKYLASQSISPCRRGINILGSPIQNYEKNIVHIALVVNDYDEA